MFGVELQVVVAFLLAVDCIVDNSSLGLDYDLEVERENAAVLVLLAEVLVQDLVVVDLTVPELVDNYLESWDHEYIRCHHHSSAGMYCC